jgi:hypothetical protein
VSDSDHSHEWDTAEKDLMGLVDTTVPVSARIWNYWLGGKDYYQVDKEAGDQFLAQYPGIAHVARAGRLFISRTVTYLVRDAGVRQFLDIGTGLPTEDNTHEVAQRIAPQTRVVYADNDDEYARTVVGQLTAALPAGSYLTICESADTAPANNEAIRTYNETGAAPYRLHSVQQIHRLFDGLNPVEPGIVPVQQWRPDEKSAALTQDIHAWGGIARKP